MVQACTVALGVKVKVKVTRWNKQFTYTFGSWLRYCAEVAQLWSAKLCTMFGRLLRWYTFSGALAP